MLDEEIKIQQIVNLATDVAQIWDIDALLEKILSAARKIVNKQNILKIIKRGAGSRFDPELIEAFFACLNTLRSIKQRFPEDR